VKNTLKHAGRTASGMLSAALLARLGMPALAALVFLAVLVLGVRCRAEAAPPLQPVPGAGQDPQQRALGHPLRQFRFQGKSCGGWAARPAAS